MAANDTSAKHPKVEIGNKWLDRVRAAEKREDAWMKQAKRAEAIYLNRQDGGAHKFYFNILHSNIETIVPAIYSQTPRPDIRRRFGDKDPAAKLAALFYERSILVQIDDGSLDPEMETLAWSAFTAGRGVIRVRLVEEDAETGELEDETSDAVEDAATYEDEAGKEGYEADEPMAIMPKVQRITFEAVNWSDFRFGGARRWEQVPWVAFRHMVTEEQIKSWSEENEDVEAQIKSVSSGAVDGAEDSENGCEVWEIWCRESKTVKFIRAKDGVICKETDDPLGLTGFFPCIRPIQPIERNGDLMPVAPFELYSDLAEELDKVTRRIQKLIEGVRVRGGAAAGELIKGVKDIAELEDNEIAEIRGVEAFAQQGGLEKGITWWPIEKSIEAITALSAHRDSIKQTIYEVTGISDIVRGASNAQETATAQQIKSQWGSLRIQKMQRLLERGVREIFVMCAELISTRFTPETLQAITGLEYTPEVDAIFKNRVARFYRIDVETDSTIKADMSKSKQEMTEFLAGTAQYIGAVGPAVQQGMMPGPLAIEIFSAFAKTFRLGKQAEDALEQLSEEAKKPQKPQIPPEVQQQIQQGMEMIQKLQQELGKVTAENQQMKADQSVKMAELNAKQDMEARKLDLEREKLGIERDRALMDVKTAQHSIDTADRATAAQERASDTDGIGNTVAQKVEPVVAQIVERVLEQAAGAIIPQVMAAIPPQKVKIPKMRRTPVRDPETGLIQYTIDEPIDDGMEAGTVN